MPQKKGVSRSRSHRPTQSKSAALALAKSNTLFCTGLKQSADIQLPVRMLESPMLQGFADLSRPDLICIVEKPTAVTWEAISVDPDEINVIRAVDDALLQHVSGFIDHYE